MKTSRRDILGALGLGAVMSPFVPMLTRRAEAQVGGFPKRLLLGPGPSEVDPEVLRALTMPPLGHLEHDKAEQPAPYSGALVEAEVDHHPERR